VLAWKLGKTVLGGFRLIRTALAAGLCAQIAALILYFFLAPVTPSQHAFNVMFWAAAIGLFGQAQYARRRPVQVPVRARSGRGWS